MAKGSKVKNAEENREMGLSKFYLLTYNLAQFLGWTYLLLEVFSHFAHGRDKSSLWNTVWFPVFVFQNAAILEIFHVALGLVKSNLMITTFQVFSRVMMVCGVLYATPTAQTSIGLPLLLVAWSISEIVRYLFYALNLLNAVPFLVIWCRYTFFYILYPLGVTGELLCFYAAQDYVGRHKLWTAELPNTVNFTFSYHYLLIGIMLLYIPLFPKMYFHMINQRKKTIGGQGQKKTT